MDSIVFEITVSEKSLITHQLTRNVTVGKTVVLFSDDAESGMTLWTTSSWDTTFIDMQSGGFCFADTRYSNYGSNDLRTVELIPPVKLAGALNPTLQFNAKWSLEVFDDVSLQASANGGAWTNLATWSEHQHWTPQRFDLGSFVPHLVSFRFVLDSDNGVQSDGFYFDDFRVVDYVSSLTGVPPSPANAISVFPNPAVQSMTLSWPGVKQVGYELTDLTGRICLRGFAASPATIDLTGQPAGMYFLIVTSGGEKGVMKVMISQP
jgi:hypothetical protein